MQWDLIDSKTQNAVAHYMVFHYEQNFNMSHSKTALEDTRQTFIGL